MIKTRQDTQRFVILSTAQESLIDQLTRTLDSKDGYYHFFWQIVRLQFHTEASHFYPLAQTRNGSPGFLEP